MHEAVQTAVEQALAGVRAWQQGIDARIARIESMVADLNGQVRAAAAAAATAMTAASRQGSGPYAAQPAAAPAAPAVAPAQLHAPTPPLPAVATVPMAAPAAAPAPVPAASVEVFPGVRSVAPPPMAVPAYTMPRDPSYADIAVDIDFGALDGSRRKKRLVTLVALLLLLGVGGLVALMMVSRAKNGL